MRWDLFCRVIDNHGDIGVCWRLAADLASRGETVRLWIDDGSALAWMAPHGATGAEVIAWRDPLPDLAPGDVVVEAFGCDPPQGFVERMAHASPPPVWINLEYLSAEDYVERSHGLRSPQRNGLTKWFFYPGFTRGTGSLLREPGLLAAREAFDADAWCRDHGIAVREHERIVSLFCYPGAPLAALAQALGDAPTLWLATPGIDVASLHPLPSDVRLQLLPWLQQPDYDRLLWSCDLNLVRGEDSFVRAQWAGVPFLWHIYPQHDGVHRAKLEAFLDRFCATAPVGTAGTWRDTFLAWNGFAPMPPRLPPLADWGAHCRHWRDRLAAMPDLATELLGFALGKR